jgi:3-hydroxyacyl-[acyl-carrier-protein] dehydratase
MTHDAMQTPHTLPSVDIQGIMRLLPHRYPMLLVDRLEDIVPYVSAVGVHNVSCNEPFFQGHFPTRPIMPGVLIVEAMAQTAGALVMYSLGLASIEHRSHVYFMSIEQAKFRKPVVPGDCLRLEVEKQRQRGQAWRFAGKAYCNASLVAEAVFTAMIVTEE